MQVAVCVLYPIISLPMPSLCLPSEMCMLSAIDTATFDLSGAASARPTAGRSGSHKPPGLYASIAPTSLCSVLAFRNLKSWTGYFACSIYRSAQKASLGHYGAICISLLRSFRSNKLTDMRSSSRGNSNSNNLQSGIKLLVLGT